MCGGCSCWSGGGTNISKLEMQTEDKIRSMGSSCLDPASQLRFQMQTAVQPGWFRRHWATYHGGVVGLKIKVSWGHLGGSVG